MEKFNKWHFLLVVFAIALLVPNFIERKLFDENTNINDSFDADLTWIQTTAELKNYIDTSFSKRRTPEDTLAYCEAVTKIIKKRFYHGFSHYSLHENWLATLAGKLVWQDLSQKVIPDDIMQSSTAACSQQGILFQSILKDKGIEFATVQWRAHFAVCAKVNNHWHYFDPNLEPIITSNQRLFDQKFFTAQFLEKIYGYRLNNTDIKQLLGTPKLVNVNILPAMKASLFHQATFFLSRVLWLFPLFVLFYQIKNLYTGFSLKSYAYSKVILVYQKG